MNSINTQNKDSYNKIANLFSQTRAYSWDDLKTLKQQVKLGDSVLDLGCGNGRLLDVLQSSNVKYLGVDFSENLLVEAKKKYPEEEFQLLDVLELDKLNRKFDIIFCVSVLNHFPKDKHDEVIQKIKSVMNPDAKLLMVNWNLWNYRRKKSVWHNKKSKHDKLGFRDVMTIWKSTEVKAKLYYYAFSKCELRKLLERNNFSVLKNYYSLSGKKSCFLRGDNIVTIARFITDEFEKKASSIQGVGIFVKKKYTKGDEVYKIPMCKIKYKNFKRYAYVGNGQYVNDEVVLNYVNHGCVPNVILDVERPDPVLIAVKDINPGDELLCDYNLTEAKGVYRRCNCGHQNCKGFFGRDKSFKVKLLK